MNNMAESACVQRRPPVVHGDSRLIHPQMAVCLPIQHAGAAGHIILDQQTWQGNIKFCDLQLALPDVHGLQLCIGNDIFREYQNRLLRAGSFLLVPHDLQRPAHFLREPDVVLIAEHDIICGSMAQKSKKIGGRAASGKGIPDYRDPPRICLLIFLQNLRRAVCRSVVPDQDPDVRIILAKQGIQLFPDIFFSVKRSKKDLDHA